MKEGQLQKTIREAFVRMSVEASAEEVEGTDDDVNSFTSSSWIFFVENSAVGLSVFRKTINSSLLTGFPFSNNDPATL